MAVTSYIRSFNKSWIASYPRSGNTMMRFAIAAATNEAIPTFDNIQQIVPDVYVGIPKGVQFVKTHDTFRKKYSDAVYLVRDPRGVAVSYFMYQLKRGGEADFNKWLDNWLKNGCKFGHWDDHVKSWIDRDVLVVRYEDLVLDRMNTIYDVLNYFGIHSQASLLRAMAYSDFSHMRKAEENSRGTSDHNLRTLQTHKEIPFVRSGYPFSWMDELSGEQREKIADRFNDTILEINKIRTS